MRTVYFYLSFGAFFVYTIFLKLKMDHILETKSQKEAQEYLDKWVVMWANFCLKRAGTTLEIVGRENLPEGNCLFISNHQGYLDIPALIAGTGKPMGFIAKKEILSHKFISYWMKKIHCVFIDRENIKESVKAINKGIDYLKEGYNLAVFPEGTRSKGPTIGEFKKGSLKLATKSGVPIVPVAINGTYKAREANKFCAIKPARVNVAICKPIIYNELSKEEQLNLNETIRGIIEKNIK